MVINMDETKLRAIAQLHEFFNTTGPVQFPALGTDQDSQRYKHISGVVSACPVPTSGYSRAQINRLVARWRENRLAALPLSNCYRAPAAPFARNYSEIDVQLPVEMNCANEVVCGPAIVHLVQRAWLVYADPSCRRAQTSSGRLREPQRAGGKRRNLALENPVHPRDRG